MVPLLLAPHHPPVGARRGRGVSEYVGVGSGDGAVGTCVSYYIMCRKEMPVAIKAEI